MCSIPTDTLTRSEETPVLACSSAVNWAWVVEAGVDHQGLHIAHVGEVTGQLGPLDKLLAGFIAARHPERKHASEAVAQISSGVGMIGVVGEAWI